MDSELSTWNAPAPTSTVEGEVARPPPPGWRRVRPPGRFTEEVALPSATAGFRFAWDVLPAMVGILLTLAYVFLIEAELLRFPVPPGGDPAHWVFASYAYVGIHYPPVGIAANPYSSYPAFLFFLGLLVRLTGSALTADFVMLDLSLFLIGVTSVYLGWALFRFRWLIPLFVALNLFNPPLFTLVFSGALPNLLGFAVLNATLAFFLRFVKTLRDRDAALFWMFAALLYLVHDLTFAVLLFTVGACLLVGWAFGRLHRAHVLRSIHALGLVFVAFVVGAYALLSGLYGIPHPGYFRSNPAAYFIDNIGEIFQPLDFHYLPAAQAVDLLVGIGLAVLAALVIYEFVAPRHVDLALILGASWLIAVVAIPVFGWVLHIDTDYIRFSFFLAVPIGLALLLVLERIAWAVAGALRTAPERGRGGSVAEDRRGRRFRSPGERSAGIAGSLGALAVLIICFVLFANVAVPNATADEQTFASGDLSHNSDFLNATGFLRHDPTPGAVLTVQASGRWVQALAYRTTWFYGDTHLQFFPFQVGDMESSYFALTSRQTVSNNEVLLAETPDGSFEMEPGYYVFAQGVVVPVLRTAAPDLAVVLTGNRTVDLNASSVTVSGPGLTGAGYAYVYSGPGFRVAMTATLDGGAPGAWMNFSATGSSVRGLEIGLEPPQDLGWLVQKTFGVKSIHANATALEWTTLAHLGQLPVPWPITTWVNFSETASALSNAGYLPSPTFANPFRIVFPVSPGGAPIALHFETPFASNPAVVFPGYFSTSQFLNATDIHFLMLPSAAAYAPAAQNFEEIFHYREIYRNAEWTIYSG